MSEKKPFECPNEPFSQPSKSYTSKFFLAKKEKCSINRESVEILKEVPKRYNLKEKLENSEEQLDNEIKIIVDNIKKIALNKKIKLKMFYQQFEELGPTKIKKALFKSSIILLQQFLIQGILPILEKRTYQTSLGKNYIKVGEKGFDIFKSYSDVIYEIHSLFDMSTTTNIYIGHTEKSMQMRFIYEIDNAIKGYTKNWSFPTRLIEKAILLAILDVMTNYGVNISGKQIKYVDLEDFITEYLVIPESIRFNIRQELLNILLKKYFEVRILEKHYTKECVSEREKWYKENYPDSNGTVFPNGLNMQSYIESVRKYVSLPLYDIVFMISLGFRVPEISKQIIKLYDIKEANEDNLYSRIRQFFNSIENAEDLLLKPVVQSIIGRFPNLKGDQIGKLLHRSGKQFFDAQMCPFKRWFVNVKLREIKKAVVIDGFNWNNLNHFIEEIRKGNYIRGKHKSQWIELFIKGASNEYLAQFAGYKDADSFRKHFFNTQESKEAFNVQNRKAAVKKYRKFKTIETIKKSKSPSFSTFEYLYANIFGFHNRYEYETKYKDYNNKDFFFERALRGYFEKLFNGISLDEIIEKYKI